MSVASTTADVDLIGASRRVALRAMTIAHATCCPRRKPRAAMSSITPATSANPRLCRPTMNGTTPRTRRTISGVVEPAVAKNMLIRPAIATIAARRRRTSLPRGPAGSTTSVGEP